VDKDEKRIFELRIESETKLEKNKLVRIHQKAKVVSSEFGKNFPICTNGED
jgi:hypothetical protein